MDKLFHSFRLSYVLKLTASQTKVFVLPVNQEGHDNLRKYVKIGFQYVKIGFPASFSDLVLPASEVHNYNTRYATKQNLYRPVSRTNYGLARFRVMASKIWETIPIEIKCLSHSSFKMQYKLFLLGNQT